MDGRDPGIMRQIFENYAQRFYRLCAHFSPIMRTSCHRRASHCFRPSNIDVFRFSNRFSDFNVRYARGAMVVNDTECMLNFAGNLEFVVRILCTFMTTSKIPVV
jgi:UDP-galactopyranose mutase